MYKKISSCRICGNKQLISVLNLGNQALTGVFPKSKDTKITIGPLELVKCDDSVNKDNCGLLQLKHSYESTEMYGENYGYRSGLNSSMVKHLNDIVTQIKARINFKKGDLVIDIGSNDSTLLKQYGISDCTYAGIDPTSEKFKNYYEPHVKRIPEFFSADTVKKHFGDKKASVITSIAMFYDLENPIDFVKDIHSVLDDNGIWVFEQSYMPLMLEQNAYDTICHEHVEYYALKQIKWMLDKVGFKIIDIEMNDINGGSFKITAAKKTSPVHTECIDKIKSIEKHEDGLKLNTMIPYEKFKKDIEKHKEELTFLLKKLKSEGKKVLGYGASTKGNVILQYCNIDSSILPFMAEVNPDKFGSYTPGTFISIISEEDAKKLNPDYFVVLPWHFKENIIQREKQFIETGGKLLFPLPKIELI